MARKRDYRTEYKRRIERALKQGYSRAIARGHPKSKTEVYTDREGKKKKRKVVLELGLKAAKFLNEKPGQSIRSVVTRDAKYVFGKVPKRTKGDKSIPAYMLRLEQLQKKYGTFDWTNERMFVEEMMAIGLTEQQAYATLGGSPP